MSNETMSLAQEREIFWKRIVPETYYRSEYDWIPDGIEPTLEEMAARAKDGWHFAGLPKMRHWARSRSKDVCPTCGRKND